MRGDNVQILNRTQKGDWYTYHCDVHGERVSLDIPCNQILSRSSTEADALVKRNAEALAQAQDDGLVGR